MENAGDNNSETYTALREYFLQADEKDICHARPSQIAQQLNIPIRDMVELLVDAMFNGDAVLHWELECPACQAFAVIPDPFEFPLHEQKCKACGHDFNVHTDEQTQVTFSPHPTLRKLSSEADDITHRHDLHQVFPPTTVYELMTVQKFRDWAQNEPLAPGEYLEVRKMILWFSDLTGSTALYARNGDPFAFNLVREHFKLVTEAVHEAEGAIVKTIGDGVMAVFATTKQGVQAALSANQRLEAFNDENNLEGDRRLQLKIGIHAGPSIVVTLNERLDYFGTTVNIASRVSNLAKGQEIIITKHAYIESEVMDMVSDYNIDAFASNIRGLDEKIFIHRVQLCATPKTTRKGLLGFLDRLGARTNEC